MGQHTTSYRCNHRPDVELRERKRASSQTRLSIASPSSVGHPPPGSPIVLPPIRPQVCPVLKTRVQGRERYAPTSTATFERGELAHYRSVAALPQQIRIKHLRSVPTII